ncbi:MAG: glycoside hydrolase family 66 protein [Calditrichia bacterium]
MTRYISQWHFNPRRKAIHCTSSIGILTSALVSKGLQTSQPGKFNGTGCRPEMITGAIWPKPRGSEAIPQYSYLNSIQIDQVLDRLNRYHINGLQFYDWHHKHHKPLKGTPDNPASTWNDIANRTNYFATVQGYILGAHKRHMKAMAYNLLYGAWEDALPDGVLPEWRLFHDSAHQQPDFHDLPSSWASDIYLMDPTNQKWMDYIFSTTRDALTALPFDGWHIDQLGDRGTLYNYQGQAVNLANSFLPVIQQAKDSLGVDLVMNAVNQFGQGGISLAPVDFLYTEVWAPNTQYADLASVIVYNNFLGHNNLKSVLAAYINHDLSGSPGQFNSPAVLLADAVIFAAGGAHLELGEHMLGSEYFPNSNLSMSQDLQTALIRYYDFLGYFHPANRGPLYALRLPAAGQDLGHRQEIQPPYALSPDKFQ